jgi:hypothetical protein
MKADEALEHPVVAWRTKHHIHEDDPMLAALDLVRVYLAHAPLPTRDGGEVPPTYAEFRETVELLDRRANAFGKQSLDLIVELRKVADRRAGKRELSLTALLLIVALAVVAGFYLGRLTL